MKLIHIQLYKRLVLDHIDKYYEHKSESVPENETQHILGDSEIKTGHQIEARRLH